MRTGRSQSRTVVAGRPSRRAIVRCPSPRALASNAAAITSAPSRRRGTMQHAMTACVRRHDRQIARRGRTRRSPSSVRRHARDRSPTEPAARRTSTRSHRQPTLSRSRPHRASPARRRRPPGHPAASHPDPADGKGRTRVADYARPQPTPIGPRARRPHRTCRETALSSSIKVSPNNALHARLRAARGVAGDQGECPTLCVRHELHKEEQTCRTRS
jgi:hypothetical protein